MTSDTRVQYKFMIPVDLKEQLEAAASKNNRSLSGEVVARLRQSFTMYKRLGDLESDTEATDETVTNLYWRVDTLERQMQELLFPDLLDGT